MASFSKGARGWGPPDATITAELRWLPAEHWRPFLPEGDRTVLARGLPELWPVWMPPGRSWPEALLQTRTQAVPSRLPEVVTSIISLFEVFSRLHSSEMLCVLYTCDIFQKKQELLVNTWFLWPTKCSGSSVSIHFTHACQLSLRLYFLSTNSWQRLTIAWPYTPNPSCKPLCISPCWPMGCWLFNNNDNDLNKYTLLVWKLSCSSKHLLGLVVDWTVLHFGKMAT